MNFDPITERVLASFEQGWKTGRTIPLVTADPGSETPLLEQLNEVLATTPPPSRAARLEVGQDLFDWLKATCGQEKRDPEMWPGGDFPIPAPIAWLFGLPLVVNDTLGPWGWRSVDRAGDTIEWGRVRR